MASLPRSRRQLFHIYFTSFHSSREIWTQQIDLAPNVWLHSSVGRASHRYRGGHGFESRWSLDLLQASSFQLLKLENLLWWSFLTFIYNHSSNMNYSTAWGHMYIRRCEVHAGGTRRTCAVHEWNPRSLVVKRKPRFKFYLGQMDERPTQKHLTGHCLLIVLLWMDLLSLL